MDAEANDPILFDGETEMVDALSLLAKVDESFQQLKADSLRFADYQEILKVPVTRYEEVEDLEIGLRLKKNLWQGLHDWGEQASPIRMSTPTHPHGSSGCYTTLNPIG